MYPVKNNFKNKIKQQGISIYCELCKDKVDDQQHLLNCIILKKLVPELKDTQVEYKDIFGSIDKMVLAVKLLMKVCSAREETLRLMSSN